MAALPLTVGRVPIPLARGCSRPPMVTAPSAPCSTNVLHSPKSAVYPPRETEVFVLLVQGRSHSFIQGELGLAPSTVKTHVSHIYAKFEVGGRQELLDLLWR